MLSSYEMIVTTISEVLSPPPVSHEITLWEPFKGMPQEEAYYSEADELYFGGQAGGGKSDLLLGLALTAHRNSVIFRREKEELGDIEARSQEIVGGHGRFNAQTHRWSGLPDGRRLEFAGMQRIRDWRKWRGRAKDLWAFDEITEFAEEQYINVTAWARSVIPGQRVRVVACGNPPAHDEGAWVVKRWAAWLDKDHANPAAPGELRWYARIDDVDTEVDGPEPFEHKGEMITPTSRTFIPAGLDDNPALRDSGYRAVLQRLPEPLRSQLLYGDFTLIFKDKAWQVIPREWIELAFDRWDLFGEPTTGLTNLGVDPIRGGGNSMIIAPRYGDYWGELLEAGGDKITDGPTAAQFVMEAMGNWRVPVDIDPIGIGASPVDYLTGLGVKVRVVNFGAGTDMMDRTNTYKMHNIRAAAFWKLREALDPESGLELALPRDSQLRDDLTAPRWKLTPSGIKIEPKEEIADRLGRSPDRGDAVLISYYNAPGGDWGGMEDLGEIDDFKSLWD